MAVSKTFVAVTDTECLGVLSALNKHYLLGGKRTPYMEIFDWHGLPGLKGSGVGIRVMRAMMREGQQLIGVGGTADVLKTLPAMGWQTIGEAETFELPLQGSALLPGLRERVRMRIPGELAILSALTATWFRPRRRSFNGRAIEVAHIGEEVSPLYDGETGYDLVQIPDAESLRWLTAGYAGAGAFRFLYFTVGNVLRGWALTRVYETEQGIESAIVDVFAPVPDVSLYAWMISEAAAKLAGSNARIIRGRATCPILQEAFRVNRFRNGAPLPVHTWPKLAAPAPRLHMTLDHGDAPFRPLPTPGAATAFLMS